MKYVLIFASLGLLLTGTAYAQPIESEPLAAPYTMKGESDPMATGAAPHAAPEAQKTINREETIIAPPPPGADDYTAGAADQTPTDAENTLPQPKTAQEPAQDQVVPNYPNNAVSGVPITDESKFEKMTFCTLKVTLAAQDTKTDTAVKTYLDSNADKFTYKHAPEGKNDHAYCLDIPEHKNRAKTYTALKKIILDGSARTPATLTGKGFAPIKR